ncbi:hypothetical protein VYU27_005635, partial [Nannochloropsis oceanica]
MQAITKGTRVLLCVLLLLLLDTVLRTRAALHRPHLVPSHLKSTPSSSSSRRREIPRNSWYSTVRGGGGGLGGQAAEATKERRRSLAVAAAAATDGKIGKHKVGRGEEEEEGGYWTQIFAPRKSNNSNADRSSSSSSGGTGCGPASGESSRGKSEGTKSGSKGDGGQQEDDFYEDMREYFKSMTPSPPSSSSSSRRPDGTPPSPPLPPPPPGRNNNDSTSSLHPSPSSMITSKDKAKAKKAAEIVAFDRVLAGVTATALALPGLFKLKVTMLAKLIWRVAFYRFPVGLGTYVCAAVATKAVVGRVRNLWQKRPVRDMVLDVADRDYQRYGVILQREAHEYFKYLPVSFPLGGGGAGEDGGSGSSSSSSSSGSSGLKLLTAALELPCLRTRRDEYVESLAKAFTELTKAHHPSSLPSSSSSSSSSSLVTALLTENLSSNTSFTPSSLPPSLNRPFSSLSVVDQGKVILSVRLGDATARLARDALLGSARRVQAAHR